MVEDQGHLLSSYAQLFQLLVKLLPVTERVVKDGLACFGPGHTGAGQAGSVCRGGSQRLLLPHCF